MQLSKFYLPEKKTISFRVERGSEISLIAYNNLIFSICMFILFFNKLCFLFRKTKYKYYKQFAIIIYKKQSRVCTNNYYKIIYAKSKKHQGAYHKFPQQAMTKVDHNRHTLSLVVASRGSVFIVIVQFGCLSLLVANSSRHCYLKIGVIVAIVGCMFVQHDTKRATVLFRFCCSTFGRLS